MSRPAQPRPVLLVVDDDERSLAVTVAGLTRRFANDFTVTGALPGEALSRLEAMSRANEVVALLLIDATLTNVLARAHELYPSAKRVLLVDRDYSNTSPAVQA